MIPVDAYLVFMHQPMILPPGVSPIQSDTLDTPAPALQIIRSNLTIISQSDQRQTKASINLSISVQIIRVAIQRREESNWTAIFLKRERKIIPNIKEVRCTIYNVL